MNGVLVAYLVMCLIFGTTFLAIKIGLEEGMPPFYFAALRFFIAGILLLCWLKAKQEARKYSFKRYAEIALLGIMMTTIPFAALYWAEQYVHSGLAALLVATAPVFATVFSVCAGQMRYRWYTGSGLVLGIIGIALIVGVSSEASAAEGGRAYLGKISIVAAEFFYAWGAIRAKKLMEEVPPLAFNAWQMVFASLGLFSLSFLFEDVARASYTLSSIVSLLYLAIVASIAASGIYYWLVRETNAVFPTTWTYVSPVIALLAGVLFLRETVSLAQLAGGVGVLVGIILLNLDTWKKILHKRGEKRVFIQ
jgi:drug/metabolite transporter (DMT)-like permease